jgi:hypothetical protein
MQFGQFKRREFISLIGGAAARPDRRACAAPGTRSNLVRLNKRRDKRTAPLNEAVRDLEGGLTSQKK